jgi:hypothetical protein
MIFSYKFHMKVAFAAVEVLTAPRTCGQVRNMQSASVGGVSCGPPTLKTQLRSLTSTQSAWPREGSREFEVYKQRN